MFWSKSRQDTVLGLPFVVSPFPSLVSTLQGAGCLLLPSTSAEPISSNLSDHLLPKNLHHGAAVSSMTRGWRAGIWKERELYCRTEYDILRHRHQWYSLFYESYMLLFYIYFHLLKILPPGAPAMCARVYLLKKYSYILCQHTKISFLCF